MVIQRWQTVWLLFAAVLAALFCFMPLAVVSDPAAEASATLVTLADFPVVMIVDALAALLLLLGIFLFKNTARQKRVTILSMLLICVVGVTSGILVFSNKTAGAGVEIGGGALLLLGALVFALMAYRGIRRDERLLRAADRLR